MIPSGRLGKLGLGSITTLCGLVLAVVALTVIVTAVLNASFLPSPEPPVDGPDNVTKFLTLFSADNGSWWSRFRASLGIETSLTSLLALAVTLIGYRLTPSERRSPWPARCVVILTGLALVIAAVAQVDNAFAAGWSAASDLVATFSVLVSGLVLCGLLLAMPELDDQSDLSARPAL